MNGMGQSMEKSFAKSKTSVPPSERREETSSESSPSMISGRNARTSLSASSFSSVRNHCAPDGFAVSVKSETAAVLAESE